MSCYHPSTLFYATLPDKDGKIPRAYVRGVSNYLPLEDFRKLSGYDGKVPQSDLEVVNGRLSVVSCVYVSCGVCLGCREAKAREWSLRALLEFEGCGRKGVFITLTFDDHHVGDNVLDKRDLQLFFKRLRKRIGPFRYLACGEYGGTTGRRHYHALLFGVDLLRLGCGLMLRDGVQPLWSSKVIQDCWPFGFNTVGYITEATAFYVAKYGVKSVGASKSGFLLMSRRPALGLNYYLANRDGICCDGLIYLAGKTFPVPSYFRSFEDYDKVGRLVHSSGLSVISLEDMRARYDLGGLEYNQFYSEEIHRRKLSSRRL